VGGVCDFADAACGVSSLGGQKQATALLQFFIGSCIVLALTILVVRADTGTAQTAQDTTTTTTVTDQPAPPDTGTVVTPTDIPASDTTTQLPGGLQRIQNCRDSSWQEHDQVWGNCSDPVNDSSCGDLQQNCTHHLTTITYPCVTVLTTVTKTRRDCTTTGFTVGVHTIDTTGYACSVQDDGKVYVTCDSTLDGNGDGICTSGESCIQFGIVGNTIIRKERNSGDSFVDQDKSFVIPRAAVTT